MNKKFAILGWIFFFITLISGIIANIFLNGYYYQIGYNDALKEIPSSRRLVSKKTKHEKVTTNPHYVISGTVLSNDNENTLVLQSQPLILSTPEQEIPNRRTITVSNTTKIIKTIIRTDEEYQKKLVDYTEKLKEFNQREEKAKQIAPTIPTKTYEKQVSIKDIQKKDIIIVTAKKDLTYIDNIKANIIRISLTQQTKNIPAPATILPPQLLNNNSPTLSIPAPAQ